MRSNKIIIPFLSIILTGCTYFRSDSEKPDTTAFSPTQVKAEMVPLNLNAPIHPTKETKAYFQFYHLDYPNTKHFFGSIVSKNQTLATHIFIPEHPKGTLFLIHGYFDHSGTFSKFISKALSNHYAVVSWDLPGHGLSSGDRTDTGAFHLCADQFKELLQRTEKKVPKPFYLITHSTGCSIAIEYLSTTSNNTFNQIIFLAPLIRHAHWGWGKFGYYIAKPFTKTIRRRKKKNSSDSEYLAFVKKDPLHSSILSFEYLKDLYAWEKQLKNKTFWAKSIIIIQGDLDSVVDWKYNIAFLKTKIEHLKIYIIHGARHQLTNESQPLRNQVFTLIFSNLK